MITLYSVISEDGFIAREDGSEDFIVDEIWSTTLELMRGYDVLVLGRRSYETLQSYEPKLLDPFEALEIRKVVISRNSDLRIKEGYELLTNADAIRSLGSNILVVSGPSLNNYLLANKLADRVVFHNVHIPIGEGMPPFDASHRRNLRMLSNADLGLVEEITFSLQ